MNNPKLRKHSRVITVWIILYFSELQKHIFAARCGEGGPQYLLQSAIPGLRALPAGVQVQYDDTIGQHAFAFSTHASGLSLPASQVFKSCEHLPDELSVLTAFKLKQNRSKEEKLLAIKSQDNLYISFGVGLVDNAVKIYYSDGYSNKTKFTHFEDKSLFDGKWHVVTIFLRLDKIIINVDCAKTHLLTINRAVPNTRVSLSDKTVFLANDNSGRSGLFSGLLLQLVVLPNGDITSLACTGQHISSPGQPILNLPTVLGTATHAPPKRSLPEANVVPRRNPEAAQDVYDPMAAFNKVCQFSNTGEIWFDLADKTMKVCYSGVWQPILLPPNKRQERRLDYFVWYQDLITSAPTIDIEVFQIPGEGLFLATASFDSNELRKTQSSIFKWNDYRFQLFQSLVTYGAQDWTYFEAYGQFYLAVANTGGDRKVAYPSLIYKWSGKRRRFKLHQEITTYTARDLEYFKIDGLHYLVVANHAKGENHSINSVLYRMEPSTHKFEPYQNLSTTGAYDWTHFQIDAYNFLVAANSFTLHPYGTTRLNSTIYFWRHGAFSVFQTLPTIGATDFEFFVIDGDYFLAVANAFDYRQDGSQSFATQSTIYILDKAYKKFIIYQHIQTHSAVDWEFFSIGDDHFLLVSNSQSDVVAPENMADPSHKRSTLYRWQGVDRFVPVHYMVTSPSADWETFEISGEVFIAYANAKENISQLYKAKFK